MKYLAMWTEVTTGLYRYVLGAGACYEIIIMLQDMDDDDITKAKAIVYVAGNWLFPDGVNRFEREELMQGTVQECIDAAVKDYEDNVTED